MKNILLQWFINNICKIGRLRHLILGTILCVNSSSITLINAYTPTYTVTPQGMTFTETGP